MFMSCLVPALLLRSSSSSNVIDWGCTLLCRKLYYFINVQTHPFTDHIWWILENISLCIVTSYLNNNYIVLTSVTPNHVDLTIFVQPLNIGPHQWDIRLAGRAVPADNMSIYAFCGGLCQVIFYYHFMTFPGFALAVNEKLCQFTSLHDVSVMLYIMLYYTKISSFCNTITNIKEINCCLFPMIPIIITGK